MSKLLMNFVRDESGQDLAEYALLLVLIGAVLVGALTAFRTQIENAFTRVTGALTTANTAAN
jgi:Flp pilus assembly pilin Flp